MISYVSVGAILIIFGIVVAAFCSIRGHYKTIYLRELRERLRRERRMRKALSSPRLPRRW
jgi:heme exporter protein D